MRALLGAPGPWTKTIALGALWLLVGSALLLVRTTRAGEAAMERSDAAFDRGELRLALERAREARAWYFPFAGHVEAADRRLQAIALGAEATGDARTALGAWGALRGALNETRHPWSTDAALLTQANAGLARLLPRAEGLLSEAVPEPALLGDFAARQAPQPAFHLATTLGLGLLLVSGSLLLTRRDLRVVTWAALSGGAGLFLWLFAASGA